MVKRKKIRLIPINCKRCGRSIYTVNRPIYGSEKIKKQYGGICEACTTPEELYAIHNELGLGMVQR